MAFPAELLVFGVFEDLGVALARAGRFGRAVEVLAVFVAAPADRPAALDGAVLARVRPGASDLRDAADRAAGFCAVARPFPALPRPAAALAEVAARRFGAASAWPARVEPLAVRACPPDALAAFLARAGPAARPRVGRFVSSVGRFAIGLPPLAPETSSVASNAIGRTKLRLALCRACSTSAARWTERGIRSRVARR